MPKWVVLKQNMRDDSFDTTWVDVDADTPEEAVRIVALEHKTYGGEGRYVPIPNKWWVGYNTTITKIAEVSLQEEGLV